MPNLDRFAVGLEDAQEQPSQALATCTCGEILFPWDDVWQFGEDIYCSSRCCCEDVGAQKGKASELVDEM